MTRAPSNLKAALWMAGWLLAMLVLAIAGRETMRELAVFQIMEMRSVIGLILLWPLVLNRGGLAAMRTRRLGHHILRNTVHYAAQFGWLVALTMIPLAQLVALGLVGVAVIVRPHAGAIAPGQMIALVAAIGFAISVITVKVLTRTESTVAIVFWMLVVQSVLGLLPAVQVWHWPSAQVWPWAVVIAVCGTFSHFCMARAMLHADATVVVPMDFLRVPLTALIGWWLYAEGIDAYTLLGAGLILCGNLLNLKGAGAVRASLSRAT